MSSTRKYTLLEESTYRGYPVLFEPGQSPLIQEALDNCIDQVEAMASHYQDLFLIRFDLHLPTNASVPPDEANARVSQLFASLRDNKFRQKALWGNQVIKRSAYGWCNELEKAKQLHYHCWVLVPKGRVEKSGYQNNRADGTVKPYGFIGMIHTLWQELNPEGPAKVHCNAKHSKRIKSSNRSDIEGAILWLSYITKERGKVTINDSEGKPIRFRRFDGSRTRRKVMPSNQDNYANPV